MSQNNCPNVVGLGWNMRTFILGHPVLTNLGLSWIFLCLFLVFFKFWLVYLRWNRVKYSVSQTHLGQHVIFSGQPLLINQHLYLHSSQVMLYKFLWFMCSTYPDTWTSIYINVGLCLSVCPSVCLSRHLDIIKYTRHCIIHESSS